VMQLVLSPDDKLLALIAATMEGFQRANKLQNCWHSLTAACNPVRAAISQTFRVGIPTGNERYSHYIRKVTKVTDTGEILCFDTCIAKLTPL
jgi:hypothetical protein